MVYREACAGYSTIYRWVSSLKGGDPTESILRDQKRSGRPLSASKAANQKAVDKMILDNRRIKQNDIAKELEISQERVQHTITDIYSRLQKSVFKVSAANVDWTKEAETVFQVFNPKTAATHDVRFTVVQNQFTRLLGLETVKRLKFVTINDDIFTSKLEISSTLGDLGEACLSLDPSKTRYNISLDTFRTYLSIWNPSEP
ncbi:histone-lysine n-methyltransferase setmar-like protein [Elysia marginata]|uniref:Histone-lysine n-methyltransferase setmar-like protein n=1 Tax=Elysia marginata TaxID=1093978 RepID=A0AAV4H9P5_9GAST|nr:histone-lysine n-methyltransferase setmar-like protein [Elysia marginata]